MTGPIVEPLLAGIKLGLAPNPLSGTLGAMIAAGLAGHRRPSRGQEIAAAAVLLVAWAVGDGVNVLRRVIGGIGSAGPFAESWPGWFALVLWALVGLAVGYALPAVAGIIVGRRVTHGTGWLAAMAVAGGVSVALATMLMGLKRI